MLGTEHFLPLWDVSGHALVVYLLGVLLRYSEVTLSAVPGMTISRQIWCGGGGAWRGGK